MVERFNRTLKTMLRKHAARFGNQWDRFLPGVLWAYCNTPHDSTGEKPSFLLFGTNLRYPTQAALLPLSTLQWTDTEDYHEELVLSLTSARSLAAESIKSSQKKYKEQFDRKARDWNYKAGDLVLVRFPQEEQGPMRKLSRPWHGPYRIVSCDDPDVLILMSRLSSLTIRKNDRSKSINRECVHVLMDFLQDISGMVLDGIHVEDHRNGFRTYYTHIWAITRHAAPLITKNEELQPVDIPYALGQDNPQWPRVRDELPIGAGDVTITTYRTNVMISCNL